MKHKPIGTDRGSVFVKAVLVLALIVVGIIAAIRRMLIITAEGASHVDLADPLFQGTLAELALLALIILMLALAMRLLRTAGERLSHDTSPSGRNPPGRDDMSEPKQERNGPSQIPLS